LRFPDQEKIIWTYGLAGCFACLVYTEHPDGTRNAVLTHYPPTEISQNLGKLNELIKPNIKMKEATKQTVLVMAAGEWFQDPVTNEYSFRIQDQQTANLLALTVEAELGAGVSVNLVPYPLYLFEGQKDTGTLLVRIPPKEKGEARFKTWFSGGTLGKPEQKK